MLKLTLNCDNVQYLRSIVLQWIVMRGPSLKTPQAQHFHSGFVSAVQNVVSNRFPDEVRSSVGYRMKLDVPSVGV